MQFQRLDLSGCWAHDASTDWFPFLGGQIGRVGKEDEDHSSIKTRNSRNSTNASIEKRTFSGQDLPRPLFLNYLDWNFLSGSILVGQSSELK